MKKTETTPDTTPDPEAPYTTSGAASYGPATLHGNTRAPEIRSTTVFQLAPADKLKPGRAGCKRMRVRDMLLAPDGTTYAAISEAIGWDRRTTYEGIRLVWRAYGYGIATDADGTLRAYCPGEDRPEGTPEPATLHPGW